MIFKKLGIDLGTKTMGVAMSDGLNMIAHPCENFYYENEDLQICIKKVKTYIDKENIDVIVLGYPLFPSGDKSKTTLYIEEFEKLLKKNFSQKIILMNEAMTTKQAHAYMLEANMSRRKRKAKKDVLAAQIILQNYLDRNN